jgi:predicted ABC-type transport system involved in lysophospholipase L1 biosynthesis ATPase subunit
MNLLDVQDLRIELPTQRGPALAVLDVGFSLARGDTLGLVGESGCGKSLTALALIGLLPEGARVSGSIRLDGQELVNLDEQGWSALRGDRIGMIFQEPMTALNPVHTVVRQVAEPLRLHRQLSVAQARAAAIAVLDRVGIPDAARRADAYPHQFSGGHHAFFLREHHALAQLDLETQGVFDPAPGLGQLAPNRIQRNVVVVAKAIGPTIASGLREIGSKQPLDVMPGVVGLLPVPVGKVPALRT